LSYLSENRKQLCHSNSNEPLDCRLRIQQRHSPGQWFQDPSRGTGSGRPAIPVWRRWLLGCWFHSGVNASAFDPQMALAGLWMRHSRSSWKRDPRGVTVAIFGTIILWIKLTDQRRPHFVRAFPLFLRPATSGVLIVYASLFRQTIVLPAFHLPPPPMTRRHCSGSINRSVTKHVRHNSVSSPPPSPLPQSVSLSTRASPLPSESRDELQSRRQLSNRSI